MRTIGRLLTIVFAGLFAVGAWTADGRAAGQFEGTWTVQDSSGKPFEITLTEDGNATGTQEEGMKGTWSEEEDTAVITWDSGWTTLISKDGDKFTKSAYKEGASLEGEPTNSSSAVKK